MNWKRYVSAGGLVWDSLYMSGQPFRLEALFTMSLNMRVVTGAILCKKPSNTGNLRSILSAWFQLRLFLWRACKSSKFLQNVGNHRPDYKTSQLWTPESKYLTLQNLNSQILWLVEYAQVAVTSHVHGPHPHFPPCVTLSPVRVLHYVPL